MSMGRYIYSAYVLLHINTTNILSLMIKLPLVNVADQLIDTNQIYNIIAAPELFLYMLTHWDEHVLYAKFHIQLWEITSKICVWFLDAERWRIYWFCLLDWQEWSKQSQTISLHSYLECMLLSYQRLVPLSNCIEYIVYILTVSFWPWLTFINGN